MSINFFRPSGPRNPCPVCGRTKDKDCRTTDTDLVYCHSHRDVPVGDSIQGVNGHTWKCVGITKTGAGWGKFKPLPKPWVKPIRPAGETIYEYRDRQGNSLVRVRRMDDGYGRKTFIQEQWDGHQWRKGLSGVDRSQIPIYRYADVRRAITSGTGPKLDGLPLVVWVEGESTADALWSVGIPATTSLGGSGGFTSYGAYYDDLAGASLVIAPDRDQKGLEYARQVALAFNGQVKGWIYAGDKAYWQAPSDGYDLADWIAELRQQGLNDAAIRQKIIDAITEPPKYQPQPELQVSPDEVKQILQDCQADLDPFVVLPEMLAKGVYGKARSLNLPNGPFVAALLAIVAGLVPHQLRLDDDFYVGTALWIALCGEPGSAKSPIIQTFKRPLDKLQTAAYESYQQQLQEWEDARRKKDDDNERLPKPRRSFYYIQSTTLEALPEALQTRQSIIWIADELRGLFGALNQYKAAGRGDDRQALLSLYDGQVIDILRKSGQIHLPRAFVSILGGIQPSVLVDVINRDKDVVDGLFARLSCVHVPITELPPTGTFNRVDIQNLLEGIYRRLAYDSEPQTFRLSPGALQVLNEWEQACERLKKAEPNGFIRALYPKARQRAARVALVLHCLNAAYHNLEPTPDIPASTMQAAVTFTHWLLAQTKAVYAESGHGQSPEAIRISKFVQRFQGMEVTPKMVRAWWSGSKKPSLSAIREFMQKLVSLGCATVAKGQPEGDGFAIFIPPGVTRGDWGGDYGLVTPEVPTGTAFSPGVTKVTNDLGNSDLPGNDGEDRKILVTPTDHNPKRPIDETFRGDYALSHPLVTPQASSQPVSPPKPDPNLPTDLIASGENDDEWDYIDLD